MRYNITVSEWNSELAKLLIPNSFILTLYLLCGITGNILVILVYTFKMKKHSEDRYFIPALAVSDLSACIVCASFGILLNMMQAQFTNNSLCKAYWFFAAFTTYMSILLLTIIAIHRYLKVCRPLRAQMSLFWKRAALLLALVLSILLGCPTSLLYGTVEFSNASGNLTGRRCSRMNDVNKTGSSIYSGVISLVILSTITVLVVCYGKVGRTIFVHFKHMSKSALSKNVQKGQSPSSSDLRSCDTSATHSTDILTINPELSSVSIKQELNTDNSGIEISDTNVIAKVKTAKTKFKTVKVSLDAEEKNRSIMYKFSLMFMVITIVFLICYLPKVILMVMEGRNPKFWENFSSGQRAGVLFLYRFYIVNNVVNPFIYAFMDMKFRQEAKNLLTCKHS
ncbi:cholecystokinin receptor type A-like [Mytilus californianus]|uniref:cholecystokinin receptor type A-like n=1 Tax=Mytilus californianus TaxID=6549 RepID=UPI002247B32C|nr:cholecystokinin receptor type A-like [Mytilus californianus]